MTDEAKNIMTSEAKIILEFEKAILLRQFEIDNFWKRGWFFGALILAIASGYFSIINSTPKPIPVVCVSFLAFLVSLGQSLMNRGSKYWQERWEYVTKNRESALKIDLTKTKKFNEFERYYIDACIRAKAENVFSRGERFSVTKIAILIWDIITISAFLIWLKDIAAYMNEYCLIKCLLDLKIWIFHLFILLYIIRFVCYGRVFEKLKVSKQQMKDSTHNRSPYFSDSNNYIKNIETELTKDII